MNLWDYYEWKAKKYRHEVIYALNITNTTGKFKNDFNSSWNTLPYFYRLLLAYVCAE